MVSFEFWGAGNYRFHIGVCHAFDVVVLVSDAVVIRHVVIFGDFAFERSVRRKVFGH